MRQAMEKTLGRLRRAPDGLATMGKASRRLALRLALWLACALAAHGALADEYVVDIITPRSGEWAGLGRSMRNGIALALEQAEDQGRFRAGVRLSLKDHDENEAAPPGGKNPAAASLAQRTAELVRTNETILVIGPMFSARAESVAASANRFNFPLLTPAISPRVIEAGPWSFKTSMGPREFLEKMVRGSISQLKPRRTAVLYPEGNEGFAGQARIAAQAASQAGTLMVGEMAVTQDEAGFDAAASALLSVNPDVIFILMDAEPAGALASRLHKAEVTRRAKLVFGPAAAQPALLETGRQFVEDAFVATDYLPELPGAQNQAFVSAYRERYGVAPDRWAGIGYATGVIAAEAIRNAGPSPNRAQVREALERGVSVTVPLGRLKWTLGPRREPQYEAALFRIKSGTFVPLDESRPAP
jgi:branched-chain amino acid transport system substrate-binding protein